MSEEVTETDQSHGVWNTIEWERLATGGILAILPAIGAYMIVSISQDAVAISSLLLALIGFTYLLYRKEDLREQIGSSLFYLAIEAFLFPIAILSFSILYVSGQEGLAAVGGAIGGLVAFFVSWFVAWLVGVVLYLVSKRFE